jgi:hypothetical protein
MASKPQRNAQDQEISHRRLVEVHRLPGLKIETWDTRLLLTEMSEKRTSGAEARDDSIALMSGINPGPTARTSFFAACLALT